MSSPSGALMGLQLVELLRQVAQTSREELLQRCRHALLLRLPPQLRPAPDRKLSLRTPRSERRKRSGARLGSLADDLRQGADTLGPGALFLPTSDGEPIHLGSDALKCELLVASAGVDPLHAHLAWTGSRWTLTDHEAPGGTWVEERRLPPGVPFPLVGAQLVRLGTGFRALFLAPQQLHDLARRVHARPAGPPAIGRDGVVFRSFAPSVAGLGQAAFRQRYPGPFLLQAADKGRQAGDARLHTFPPPDQAPLLIGRAPGCALRLEHETVSSRHAKLSQHPRVGWRVQDQESANGTWLNGRRLPAGVVVALQPGCAVRFGRYRAMLLDAQQVWELARQLCGGSVPSSTTGWSLAAPPALIANSAPEQVVLFDDARPPQRGTLTTISQVQELMIWLERERRTGTLTFTPADGEPTPGRLLFARGRVVAARIGPHQGKRALERVCLSPGGEYAFRSEIEPEETNLNVSIYRFVCTELGTAQLLQVGMEAMRAKRGEAA